LLRGLRRQRLHLGDVLLLDCLLKAVEGIVQVRSGPDRPGKCNQTNGSNSSFHSASRALDYTTRARPRATTVCRNSLSGGLRSDTSHSPLAPRARKSMLLSRTASDVLSGLRAYQKFRPGDQPGGRMIGKADAANFVGQWAPPFLISR